MRFLLLKVIEGYKDFGKTGKSFQVPSTYPPIGLEYIGAALEHSGHKVEILDFGIEKISKEHLKNHLMKSDAVGMSVYTNNYTIAAEVSKNIKEIDPDIPLIIGGPHCTFLGKSSLSHVPHADIAVELEGEIVIQELAQYFLGKEKLSNINGIHYRKENKILSGKPPKIIKNLDDLHFPARHLTFKYDYGNFLMILDPKKKFTSISTSRGCPFHCRFCPRFGNIEGWGFRKRSIENVVEELQEIDHKYNSVMIVDDNFIADLKRTNKLMDEIIDLGLNLELYILGARVDTANLELYKKMREAGVKYVNYGIESGSQEILNFYNKNITLKQIQKATYLAHKMNFITQGTLIFGAPIENKDHIEKTIRFVNSLPLDIVIFQPLTYEIGADLWLDAVKNKKISKDEYYVDTDSGRGLGNFTPEELNNFIKKAYRRFYFNPNYLVRLFYKTFVQRNLKNLKNTINLTLSYQWRKIL